jgi:hypothetical protein
MPIYQHTQAGTLIQWSLAAVAVLVAILALCMPAPLGVGGIVAAVLVICLVLFRSLTVTVTTATIVAAFGPGLIRKTFRVENICGARIVRNPWYYGWGIHLTPHGWLFNVSGFDAIELEQTNKHTFRIGTDEPAQLLAAICKVAKCEK